MEDFSVRSQPDNMMRHFGYVMTCVLFPSFSTVSSHLRPLCQKNFILLYRLNCQTSIEQRVAIDWCFIKFMGD